MASPFRNVKYGESRGENHDVNKRFRYDPADKKAFMALDQKTKDSLQVEAYKYNKPFFSPKFGVNVDPEDGVLSNRPVYSDNTKLTYDKIDKPFSESGAPTKRLSTKEERNARKKKFVNALAKTAYDIGSNFLKGAPGLAATMLTPSTAYAQGRQMPDFIEGGVDNRSLEELERDGPIPLPKFKEETPLNKSNEPRKTTKGKGRNFRTTEEGAGMTEKGVEEYKKKNPGSNLQTAVTEKNPKGKRAARRKSFCARSKGWDGERGRAARRRWNC